MVENFGRNVVFSPAVLVMPQAEHEVLQVLEDHKGQSIRVMASGHAWSDGISTNGVLLNLKHINHISLNPQRRSVTVGAGCQVKHLLQTLRAQGLTLPSVGLIDEQTVAGATATGTHGSGNHSLSQFIRSARVAHYDRASGKPVITEIEGGNPLKAARCSLGLLGVIVEVELDTRPLYNVQEHAQRHGSLEQVLAAEEQYPLQQFFLMPWSWQFFGQHRVETDKPRSKLAGLYRLYWHLGIDWGLGLIICLLARFLKFRWMTRGFFRWILPLLVPRQWQVVDNAHQMLVMEHELFRHIEIEFFVTRCHLEQALQDVKNAITVFGGLPSANPNTDPELQAQRGLYCHHYPICIRRVLADDTLISMTSPGHDDRGQDWYAISLISYAWPGQREGFFAFANYLARTLPQRYAARCHWGKYNPLNLSQNELLYPLLAEFRELAKNYDANGQFANEWLRTVLLGDSANCEP